MSSSTLKIATVQFPLTKDIVHNRRRMEFWIEKAASAGAEVVHFSEAALTGYYSIHLKDIEEIDRSLLKEANGRLRELAGKWKVWLVYGSTHFTASSDKPFNSLYLVNPRGRETCRYDKIFLTNTDMEFYAPGNSLVTARIKDFKVGLTICFDMRFPELFRRYNEAGVNLILISSYQAKGERATDMKTVAPANLITRAAENGINLSASNTSEAPSWHESMIIRFNGRVLAKARRHRASMALATLDAKDSEPFTNFIRRTAESSARAVHPVLNTPLAEKIIEVP